MKIKWTTEPPSEPGLYWVKRIFDVARPVEFLLTDAGNLAILEMGSHIRYGFMDYVRHARFQRSTEPIPVPE